MSTRRRSVKIRWVDRSALRRLALLFFSVFILLAGAWFVMLRMPGQSYQGELPVSIQNRAFLEDVEILATEIGPRNVNAYDNLIKAERYLETSLKEAGYSVQRQSFQASDRTVSNLEVEILGSDRTNEIVIIGGHYDTAYSSQGANDNATGAIATLELARRFAGTHPSRTLRFVEFVNEEPPYFQTDKMGSFVYAKRAKERKENIVAMVSLETLGYYTNAANSQKYPPPLNWLYPSQGNFVAFISNLASGDLARTAIATFRDHAKFPSEGVALPTWIPGVGWSDQWSFWQHGFPAIMVTDTAPYRYPHYHTSDDTPDQLNYNGLARVVAGLEPVVAELADLKR